MSANLSVVDGARLPETYEQARSALSLCVKVDECQQWADKAQALASYSKQANDDTMRKLCDRIQARAIRRCGELLRAIEANEKGGRRPNCSGAPTVSRTQAARDAGLSRDQKVTALRVANVDEGDFERQVESDDPPTVTALAEQGRQRKPLVDLGGIPPADYSAATMLIGSLSGLADFCRRHDAPRMANSLKLHEIADIRRNVETIDDWLDRFIINLPS